MEDYKLNIMIWNREKRDKKEKMRIKVELLKTEMKMNGVHLKEKDN